MTNINTVNPIKYWYWSPWLNTIMFGVTGAIAQQKITDAAKSAP